MEDFNIFIDVYKSLSNLILFVIVVSMISFIGVIFLGLVIDSLIKKIKTLELKINSISKRQYYNNIPEIPKDRDTKNHDV